MLYAIFGTSRQLVVAGTSASAVLIYSAVTALHPTTVPGTRQAPGGPAGGMNAKGCVTKAAVQWPGPGRTAEDAPADPRAGGPRPDKRIGRP